MTNEQKELGLGRAKKALDFSVSCHLCRLALYGDDLRFNNNCCTLCTRILNRLITVFAIIPCKWKYPFVAEKQELLNI